MLQPTTERERPLGLAWLRVGAWFSWEQEHERCGDEDGNPGEGQSGVQAAGSLTDDPHQERTYEAAEIGDGTDECDSGSGGEATQEFAGQCVERAIDAVDTDSGQAQQHHGR
jgi:hypothetical protein